MSEKNSIEILEIELRQRFNRLQEEINNAQIGIIAERANFLTSQKDSLAPQGQLNANSDFIKSKQLEMANTAREIIVHNLQSKDSDLVPSAEQICNTISELQSISLNLFTSGASGFKESYTPEEILNTTIALSQFDQISILEDSQDIETIKGIKAKNDSHKPTASASLSTTKNLKQNDDIDELQKDSTEDIDYSEEELDIAQSDVEDNFNTEQYNSTFGDDNLNFRKETLNDTHSKQGDPLFRRRYTKSRI